MKYAVVSFISGIFIDLDHLIDYYLFHKKIDLKFRQFYYFFINYKFEYLLIFLHSFELVFLFWAAIWFLRLGLFWIALAAGFTQHMVLDLSCNPLLPQAYFFLFRLKHDFKKSNLFKT